MIQRAEQSIPNANTTVSRSPSRTCVAARTTGASTVTPGTWLAVLITAGPIPPWVAAPTMRSGAGPAIR